MMSYQSLGAHYDATFSVLGKSITAGVDVPIEQAVADALAAVTPQLLTQVPVVVDAAMPEVLAALQKQAPSLVTKVLPTVRAAVIKEATAPALFLVALTGVAAVASVISAAVLLKRARA